MAVLGGPSAATSAASGDIRGPDLARDYPRILLLRLRRLEGAVMAGAGARAWDRCATVGEAVAAVVAQLYDFDATLAAGASPAELADTLFGPAAPSTLWLLDGFDEVPGAMALAPALTAAAAAAYTEGLTARRAGAHDDGEPTTEERFRAGPAADVPPQERVAAVLRVLVARPFVVVSSRPQFEGVLGRVSGRPHARFVRLEPLRPEAVQSFVRAALKVRRGYHATPALRAALFLHPCCCCCYFCRVATTNYAALRPVWPPRPLFTRQCAHPC